MEIKQAKLFKKQARMMQKRGVNMLELRAAVEAIVENNHDKLVKMNDHALKGRLIGDRELHIESHGDWLLRYRVTGDTLILWLLATGSHRDVLNIE
ncbi:type II toxin-antitoxin system YafQ family toxin [Lacticaseibacillus songhuajiangensis]|jgi:mRNA interferase YafQ|uniref:type II toxin-antitoxin system YafQ family toxin n=1 Tax=Lacticaseibacillus songhuajiangensis TaxID=1296539 RepID=UPI000F790C7A|nr:type II toxin-antitoxin system YafQ family toxin [Lacticaseibacillus songhuajiangensis]